LLVYLWFLTNLLSLLQKFSFQDIENARIKIATDRTVPDPKDLDHEDKMPKNTCAASATGKASSSRHSIQDWSGDDSDEECLMYYDPMPLSYAFPTILSSVIPDEEVIDAAPLNQGPPSTGARASRKCRVKPQPKPAQTQKRQKIGVPIRRSRGLLPRGNFLPLISFLESFFF
jgi:hypothetical protein